jgi:glycosyltransferase involved in cell wall biosynthesis
MTASSFVLNINKRVVENIVSFKLRRTVIAVKNRIMPEVSVILPAYNESLAIGYVISAVAQSLDHLGLPYEIIVVDDGSVDLTAEMAKEAGAKVISIPYNRGKGYALRKGIGEALGDIIVTMDASGMHDPREITELIEPLKKGADIVAGSRFLGRYGEDRSSFSTRFANFLVRLTIEIFTEKRVSDVFASYRSYKANVVKNLELRSDGLEIESEITIKALKRGLNYLEVPIKTQPRRYYRSRRHVLSDGLRVFKAIYQYGWR